MIGLRRLHVFPILLALAVATVVSGSAGADNEGFTVFGTVAGAPAVGDEGNGPRECQPETAAGPTDPVDLRTGEFFITGEHHLTPDPVIRVRGLTLDFTRSYRSQFGQNDVAGYGWDLRIHKRLRRQQDATTEQLGETMVVSTGTCREMIFNPLGTSPQTYSSPAGMAGELTEDGAGHRVSFGDGSVWRFDANGLITTHEDRFGNTITYDWSDEPEPVHGVPSYLIRALTPPTGVPDPFFEDNFSSLLILDYRLESVTDPTGRVVSLEYDPVTGRLAAIEDWTGRRWTYQHDVLGNLEHVTSPPTTDHPSGARTTYVYGDTESGDPHNLTEIIMPALQGSSPQQYFLSQTYSAQGKVEEQVLADGAVLQISYDSPAAGQTTVNDGNGTDTIYTFDASGELASEKVMTRGVRAGDPPFFGTTYLYDPLGRRTRETLPDGRYTLWIYDDVANPGPQARGNVARIERHPQPGANPLPAPLVTQLTYATPFNQIATITDPKGQVTNYSYSPTSHNLEKIELPEPRPGEGRPEIGFTWTPHGQIESIEDANGNVTFFDYDANGYLDRVTRAYGTAAAATTELDPDALGRPTKVLDPNGHSTGLAFNAWDRLETITAPAPFAATVQTSLHYDGNRNLARIDRTTAGGDGSQTTLFGYTPRNQLETITDELGHQIELGYDPNGNRDEIFDAEDHRTALVFDERNLAYTVTDAESRTTTFDYHVNGTLARVEDGAGRDTLYDYDPFDRLDEISHAATSEHPVTTEGFLYDANSNLLEKTTRAGATIGFAYDALDRLREKTTPAGNTTFTYDLGGRLQTASNPAIALDFDYNARDQLTHEKVTNLAGYPGGDLPLVLETLRDAAHNLTRLTHPDGTAFSYSPDAMDRLDAILDGAGTTTLVDFVYDPLSLLTQQVFGAPGSPRAAMQIDYDLAGRVDEIRHLGTSGTSLAVLDYLLDPTGAVDQIDDLAGAPVGSVLDYGYDLTKQLTSVVYPSGHPADADDTSWQYDAAGNRELETIGADPAIDYVPNALNQYASIGGTPHSHDLNGNLTGDGTRTLGWDVESQLASASVAGTAASYAYDPLGRRVRKTVDGTDTWFLWSGDRLLEERDDTGALAVRYTYGVGYAPVQVRIADGGSGEDVYDVHTDHLDTPRRLTDAAGAEVWVAEMAAFGEAFIDPDPDGDLDDVTFNTRFPGQYFDAETGLHYNRFRYYDPSIGRYISADPIGQFGGGPLNSDTNLYAYVWSNPVNWFDPLGLFVWPAPPVPPSPVAPVIAAGAVGFAIGTALEPVVSPLIEPAIEAIFGDPLADADTETSPDCETEASKRRPPAEKGKPGRKPKETREDREKKRKKPGWRPFNDKPPKEPPRHTPSRKD